MVSRKTAAALMAIGLVLASCSHKTSKTTTGSGTISNIIIATGPVTPAVVVSGGSSSSLSEVPPSYSWPSFSSTSASSIPVSSQWSSSSSTPPSSQWSSYSSIPFSSFSSSSVSVESGSVPPWCIQRIGPQGEEILDASDPAFDCSKQAPPPYSLCPHIWVESYQGGQQSSPITQSSSSSTFQLFPYSSSSSSSYSYSYSSYSYSSSSTFQLYPYSSSSSLGYLSSQGGGVISVASQTSSGIEIAGGRNRLSIVTALFGANLTCGKGVTMGRVLIDGMVPFSACIAKSPWKAYGQDINSF